MPAWADFEREAPELAVAARSFLDAHVHKTLATIRADGSPRISGTELNFQGDDVWIGSMLDAYKARDLQRDPRYAVHSGSDSPPDWKGDAKFSGVAHELTDEETIRDVNGPEHVGKSHLFRLDIELVSVVHMNDAGDRIIVETWKPGAGVSRIERD
ncbi:MAG TPA: pyridoxamine 5'-phosphate oxidase family protein [Baekduia sp.]|nr:pyridoxamine 5'-phosphate oxidase family protein [Baekduia sp.]